MSEENHDSPTIRIGGTASFAPVAGSLEPEPPTEDRSAPRKGLRRGLIAAGGVAGVLVVLYGLDLLLSSGSLPRGTTVAGVDVGGLGRADAEQRLHSALDGRIAQPVKLRAGDVDASLDAESAGLAANWSGTLDQASSQPLNPFTRLTSFFGQHESPFVSTVDETALGKALDGLRPKVDRDPVEGTIRFEGTTPTAVNPQSGRKLDAAAAKKSIVDNWIGGAAVALPVSARPAKVSADAVRAALENFAKPAVAGPVTVKGEGKEATLQPAAIAAALSFAPGDDGKLAPKLDHGKVAAPPGRSWPVHRTGGQGRRRRLRGRQARVKPSVDGRGVDWDPSLSRPGGSVAAKGQSRRHRAVRTRQPAKVTTEQANQLGIKEVVGEFTTGGFAADSGVNIRVVAEKVDGAVVKPGETFSLNGYTGPRGTAGLRRGRHHRERRPARKAVGGGISQFATTLYNASYFAGMVDAGHTEHSYYISRYPAAREATVFQNPDGSSVIDLKFSNDGPTGIAIQTIWTPQNITVRLWGTKRYQVESVPGERTDFVDPQPRPGPAANCHASAGGPGFTATDTRVIKDLAGREVSRHTRKKVYDPAPKITCG